MPDVSKDASARMLQAECRPTVELEIPAGTPFEAVLRDPDWILEIVKELGPRGCERCLSGRDFLLKERFEKVINVQLGARG